MERHVTEGTRFTRKLWNVEKLMCMNVPSLSSDDVEFSKIVDELHDIDKWILYKFSKIVDQATDHMENFQFDKTRKIVVDFVWHELADHYLELIKHRLYDPEDKTITCIMYHIGLGIIKLLAPLLPHITEEIYHKYFKNNNKSKSIHLSSWPVPIYDNKESEILGTIVKDFIRSIRHWKSEHGIPLNTELNYVGIISESEELHDILDRNKQDIIATIKAKVFEFIIGDNTELKVSGIKPIYSTLGPEFKEKSNEIISKINSVSPDTIYHQMKDSNYFELELKDGQKVRLTPEHLSIETSKQIYGREVSTINQPNLTILIEK